MVNQFTASAPGHSGKSALKLLNKPVIGFVANGMITNGAIHGEKTWNQVRLNRRSQTDAWHNAG